MSNNRCYPKRLWEEARIQRVRSLSFRKNFPFVYDVYKKPLPLVGSPFPEEHKEGLRRQKFIEDLYRIFNIQRSSNENRRF